MAKLSEPVGSLTDGAERFDRLIQGVKDRQLSEVTNAPAPKTIGAAFAVSPEEAWSRRFMTAGIGPQAIAAPQMPSVGLTAPFSGQPFKPAVASEAVVADEMRLMPRGQPPAKPARRRSWVGRFFFGD